MGEKDMMCIAPYSFLESYHFFLSKRSLGESKLKRISLNEDCEQEATTILPLFLPAHYPGQLWPHLQPANLKKIEGAIKAQKGKIEVF